MKRLTKKESKELGRAMKVALNRPLNAQELQLVEHISYGRRCTDIDKVIILSLLDEIALLCGSEEFKDGYKTF